jgi:hypothetical protein
MYVRQGTYTLQVTEYSSPYRSWDGIVFQVLLGTHFHRRERHRKVGQRHVVQDLNRAQSSTSWTMRNGPYYYQSIDLLLIPCWTALYRAELSRGAWVATLSSPKLIKEAGISLARRQVSTRYLHLHLHLHLHRCLSVPRAPLSILCTILRRITAISSAHCCCVGAPVPPVQ